VLEKVEEPEPVTWILCVWGEGLVGDVCVCEGTRETCYDCRGWGRLENVLGTFHVELGLALDAGRV
jgi:hypothetical protein